MRLEDTIPVSVDDHVVEPPDPFDQHLPDRWKPRVPRIRRLPDGSEVWVLENQPIPIIGLNAVVGRRPEEYGDHPTAYAQMRPGCWDVDERVRDTSAKGVLASIGFPPAWPAVRGPKPMAEEIHRVALEGCFAVSFAESLDGILPGLPSLRGPRRDE